eukprot:CCRYP_001719-RA/>CCRYP_001719-RA protein AED:0.55 eAED:0.27 QI:0/-1/0/1/-1/0/1/0/424
MLASHFDSNAILIEPFQSHNDRHRIPAYSRLVSHLQARGHTVNHQVLDNKASAEFIHTITQDWKATYQLVPPDIHRRNLAKRAIQTFKAHFLSILAGISKSFPNYLWDKLLPQTELTLNLLQQSSVAPSLSAWEYFNNTPFNFDATPLGPCRCPVLIHNKPSKRSAWAFHGRDGFNIGPALSHYCCFQVVDADTKAIVISNTIDFRHTYLSPPSVSFEDRLLQAITFLSTTINEATDDSINAQLIAIDQLRKIFSKWKLDSAPLVLLPPSPPIPKASPPSPRTLIPAPREAPPLTPCTSSMGGPRHCSKGAQPHVAPPGVCHHLFPTPTSSYRSITTATPRHSQRPRSGQGHRPTYPFPPLAAAREAKARANTVMLANIAQVTHSAATTNTLIAAAVLDHDTGQSLEYRQLIKHPKYQEIWSSS